MKKRILISPNSFKECANSVSIAELIKDNLSFLNNDLIINPISDGGDGFLDVCHFYFGGELSNYSISTAFDDSLIECPVLYCKDKNHIYIESAEILGLKMVPPEYRNPIQLSSKGLGELLIKIENDVKDNRLVVKKVFIGIGGTATIDMGIGMMSKLGLNFYDLSGNDLSMLPINFLSVKDFNFKHHDFPFEIISVLDVINPLIGENNGVRVFGKQKNAGEEDILLLEKSFNHLLKLFINNGLLISSDGLSGTGGGIPAALKIFFNCKSIPAGEFIFNNLNFDKYLEGETIDYIITGEGAYDNQSNFGKGARFLISRFEHQVKNIFLICGKIEKNGKTSLPDNIIPFSISDYFDTEAESILNYKKGIEIVCQEIKKHVGF